MAIASSNYNSNANLSVTTNATGSSTNTVSISTNSNPASGTGSGQINLVFYPPNPVATTTPLVYDVNGGGLLHIDGVTAFNLATCNQIRVIGRATSGTATITVGGGANPIMPAQTIDAVGGEIDLKNFIVGTTVTAGSNDKLTITASAGSVPIEVLVVGK